MTTKLDDSGVMFADGTVMGSAKQLGMRNRLINGNPRINQRGVSGTVVLAAGAYGHDRWKAGASGCTYTFATSANVTTITISAGSLQQAIEGVNLQSGTHVLSWSGTAQGRIDGGAYGASGAVTATAVGGTNMTVEFNTGTVSKAQLEEGSRASLFEQRLIGTEMMLCEYYCRPFSHAFLQTNSQGGGYVIAQSLQFPAMQAAPTFSANTASANTGVGATSAVGLTRSSMYLLATTNANGQIQINYTGLALAEI